MGWVEPSETTNQKHKRMVNPTFLIRCPSVLHLPLMLSWRRRPTADGDALNAAATVAAAAAAAAVDDVLANIGVDDI